MPRLIRPNCNESGWISYEREPSSTGATSQPTGNALNAASGAQNNEKDIEKQASSESEGEPEIKLDAIQDTKDRSVPLPDRRTNEKPAQKFTAPTSHCKNSKGSQAAQLVRNMHTEDTILLTSDEFAITPSAAIPEQTRNSNQQQHHLDQPSETNDLIHFSKQIRGDQPEQRVKPYQLEHSFHQSIESPSNQWSQLNWLDHFIPLRTNNPLNQQSAPSVPSLSSLQSSPPSLATNDDLRTCAKMRHLSSKNSKRKSRVIDIVRTESYPDKMARQRQFMRSSQKRDDILLRILKRKHSPITKKETYVRLKNLSFFDQLDPRVFPYLDKNKYPFDHHQRRVNPAIIQSKQVAIGKSSKHGFGVFAMEDIKKGEKVIEYIGEILNESQLNIREEGLPEARKGTVFAYVFDSHAWSASESEKKEPRKFVDALFQGNESRFFNHSCSPNCESETVWSICGTIHILISSLRDVSTGTELTLDYDLSTGLDGSQLPCSCNAPNCLGYLGQPA